MTLTPSPTLSPTLTLTLTAHRSPLTFHPHLNPNPNPNPTPHQAHAQRYSNTPIFLEAWKLLFDRGAMFEHEWIVKVLVVVV